jgi:hypothetical protein
MRGTGALDKSAVAYIAGRKIRTRRSLQLRAMRTRQTATDAALIEANAPIATLQCAIAEANGRIKGLQQTIARLNAIEDSADVSTGTSGGDADASETRAYPMREGVNGRAAVRVSVC